MTIRIQPRDIEIPKGDPFKYDLLEREEPIRVLTSLIASLEGSCVMSIDSSWGNGKTTFLRLWEQYLLDSDFLVIKFSAWETDFASDPLIALSKELLNKFEEFGENRLDEEQKGKNNARAGDSPKLGCPDH